MSSSSLFASLGAALQSFSSPRFSVKVPNSMVKSNPDLVAFESELASRLEQLKSSEEAGYLNMSWLCEALDVVLLTHINGEAFAPDLRQALGDGEIKLLNDYLHNNVKLLDVCQTLRKGLSDIKRYQGHVQVSLRALERGPLGEAQLRRARNALRKCLEALDRKDDIANHHDQRRSKLENCSSILRRMGEKLNTEDASKGNVSMVIYAAQVSTIFVCGVLASALSFKPRRSLSSLSVGGHSSWSLSLTSLQQRVKEQIEKKKGKGVNALLDELNRSDRAAQILINKVQSVLKAKSFPLKREQVLEVKEAMGSLRNFSMELNQGIGPLEVQLDKVYNVLITSRMALLEMCSHV